MTTSALDKATAALADYLVGQPELDLADVAYTLQVGRRTFSQRRFVVCADREEAVTRLRSYREQALLTADQGAGRDTQRQPVAFLFPGQGAQYAGMGKDLAERWPLAREIYARADELLGLPISRICFEGPAEELNRTDVSQPAILLHSWVVVELLRTSESGRAMIEGGAACAGLSLGEYSALAAAGAMEWPDALVLVRKRGQFMQDACDLVPSTMASVLALDEDKLGAACKRATEETAGRGGVVVIANFNAPEQIVISGSKEAVTLACQYAKEAGAKRCIELSVAGAFHSPLMEPARARLEAEIDAVRIADPKVPVVANVTARSVTTADEARRLLVAQLTAPVRWAASMELLVQEGFNEFVELGPGTVLAGLLKKVAKDHPKVSLGTAESLAGYLG